MTSMKDDNDYDGIDCDDTAATNVISQQRCPTDSSSSVVQRDLIMSTADDAIKTKYAAVVAGYYKDPFLPYFYNFTQLKKKHQIYNNNKQTASIPDVQVIIKRGTFARVQCIERSIDTFLNCCSTKYNDNNIDKTTNRLEQQTSDHEPEQDELHDVRIIVLGAGYDTCYFRFVYERMQHQKNLRVKWYEIDHNEIMKDKISIIQQPTFPMKTSIVDLKKQQQTTNSNNSKTIDNDDVIVQVVVEENHENDNNDARSPSDTSSCYYIGFDLYNDPKLLFEKLQLAGICCCPTKTTTNIPTLIISECIQMYLPTNINSNLLQTFCTNFQSSCYICCYEPILGRNTSNNSFGQMMEQNFKKAGFIPSSSTTSSAYNNNTNDDDNNDNSMVLSCRTVSDYLHFFKETGFTMGCGCDMYTAYETIIPTNVRAQAIRCEFLDEIEEFQLIMKHYCFIFASNDTTSTSTASIVSLCNSNNTDGINNSDNNNSVNNIENDNRTISINTIGQQMCSLSKTITVIPSTKTAPTQSTASLGFVQGRCETME